MTLDKFGRHIEHHKTKIYTNKIIPLISRQIKNLELNYIKKINILKNDFQTELSKVKSNLKSIIVINLKLKLEGDTYNIINSSNLSFYNLPCTGKIIQININNPKERLNYRFNNEPRISIIVGKHVVKGDKLIIYPSPMSLRTSELYMEIALEIPVNYVEN